VVCRPTCVCFHQKSSLLSSTFIKPKRNVTHFQDKKPSGQYDFSPGPLVSPVLLLWSIIFQSCSFHRPGWPSLNTFFAANSGTQHVRRRNIACAEMIVLPLQCSMYDTPVLIGGGKTSTRRCLWWWSWWRC